MNNANDPWILGFELDLDHVVDEQHVQIDFDDPSVSFEEFVDSIDSFLSLEYVIFDGERDGWNNA